MVFSALPAQVLLSPSLTATQTHSQLFCLQKKQPQTARSLSYSRSFPLPHTHAAIFSTSARFWKKPQNPSRESLSKLPALIRLSLRECQSHRTALCTTARQFFSAATLLPSCQNHIFPSILNSMSADSQSAAGAPVTLSGQSSGTIYLTAAHPAVPFGTDILISDKTNPLFVLGTELCEDVWVPLPPSTKAALAGATIIANLSASNEIVGKAEYRRLLLKAHSAHTVCAYIYADAGHDESTQDMIFASHNMIAENGTLLAESNLFSNSTIYSDIDLERIAQERRKTTSYAQCTKDVSSSASYRKITIDICSHCKEIRKEMY